MTHVCLMSVKGIHNSKLFYPVSVSKITSWINFSIKYYKNQGCGWLEINNIKIDKEHQLYI